MSIDFLISAYRRLAAAANRCLTRSAKWIATAIADVQLKAPEPRFSFAVEAAGIFADHLAVFSIRY